MNPIIVLNLPSRTDLQFQLFNVSNSMHHSSMLTQVMTKSVSQNPPAFESAIDSFMSSSSQTLSSLLFHSVKVFPWNIKPLRVATVAIVSNSTLISLKHVNQLHLGNFQVRELTTWKWSIQPDNPTSLNTDTNFIPDTWPLELLAKPSLVEGMRLTDPEVSTINCNLASTTIVVHQAILPSDLSFIRNVFTIVIVIPNRAGEVNV